jgi:hypothetical protein
MCKTIVGLPQDGTRRRCVSGKWCNGRILCDSHKKNVTKIVTSSLLVYWYILRIVSTLKKLLFLISTVYCMFAMILKMDSEYFSKQHYSSASIVEERFVLYEGGTESLYNIPINFIVMVRRHIQRLCQLCWGSLVMELCISGLRSQNSWSHAHCARPDTTIQIQSWSIFPWFLEKLNQAQTSGH